MLFTINDFILLGLKNIRVNTIRPILRPYIGQEFNLELNRELNNRLYSLEYFKSVQIDVKKVPGNDNAVNLEIIFEEKRIISDIEFRNYEDIPFNKVIKEPYLYRGVFMQWKGKIANLKRKDNKLIFNFLVDYKNVDTFAGIIDVFSEKNFKEIQNGDIVMLRGVLINTIGSDNRVYVVANKIEKI